MNLPVILDIAIGLFFIYLIASLLASEIQELISTVLQWRAKHLRESIQNLLIGGQSTAKDDQVGEFLETIYSDPLIRNMNQRSRGLIGSIGQWFYHNLLYRKHSIFGQETSAPSYIPPETFATALLERVGMANLIIKLTEIRLEKFIERIIGHYDIQEEGDGIVIPGEDFFQDKDYREKGSIRVLSDKAKSLAHSGESGLAAKLVLTLDNHNSDYVALVEEYNDLLRDFKSGEADLETCVERMKEGLDVYISQMSVQITNLETATGLDREVAEDEFSNLSAQVSFSDLEKQQLNYFKKRLIALKTGTFGEEIERAIASGRLKPTLLEIAEVFDRASMTYQEIEGAYQDIAAAYTTGMISRQIKHVLGAMNDYIAQAKSVDRRSESLTLGTLPDKPLDVADLADPTYQSGLNKILLNLSAEDRQVYKNWQFHQQSFVRIMTAIATSLQRIGRLFNGETELSQPVTEIDLVTLHQSVIQSLKTVERRDADNLNQSVLAQLGAADQQTYKGWQIYQHVVLEVLRDLAQVLQEEGRFFTHHSRMVCNQPLTEFDDVDLYQAVRYSLNLLSSEERQLRINAAMRKLSTEQRKIYSNYQTYEQIQDLLAGVPTSVKQSLAILARRAQTKVEQTKDQLDQFNGEVARWFDRSMNRASGVYKRNAKGVAIMIGFVIALVSNADTFHVVARLSGDDDLRQVITTRASSIAQNARAEDLYSREKLRELKQNTDAALQEISLPLRWTPENLSQQFNCRSATAPNPPVDPALPPWQAFYKTCLNEDNAPERFDLFRIGSIAARPRNLIDAGRMLLGWLVTGIAIAMGAPFWFDLLSKIMNVRNTGAKPASIADKETTKTGG
ncbi:MAG: hypothetical protein NW224_20700 [Leptolyngbyaceae cyanobacterium bins.302]|nr:hypothetical protein [Leptolyngbyaceae cyanobacterium bins.302]